MKKFFLLIAAVFLLPACDDDNKPYDPAPDEEDSSVEITFTETSTRNVYILSTNIESTVMSWDPGKGDGRTLSGNDVTAVYPLKGTYTVTLNYRDMKTYENRKRTKQLVIEQDNEELLAGEMNPVTAMLTGGTDYPGGKGWVLDSLVRGHIGNSSPDDYQTVWWTGGAYEKSNQGVYDDRVYFHWNSDFIYVNNDITMAQGDALEEMRARGGDIPSSAAGDSQAAYTPGQGWKWDLANENGTNFIKFDDGGGFMIYYTKSPHTYEILDITEEYLNLRQIAVGGVSWHFKLIPEGSTPANDFYFREDYEGYSTNVIRLEPENEGAGGGLFVNNPYIREGNLSEKVGCYSKSSNYYTRYAWYLINGGKLNLSAYPKVKMKVFIPSTNDYDTEHPGESWAASTRLQRTVAVRLQDNSDPEPWNNEAKLEHSELATDTWLELDFDFSPWASRTDFDVLIIQFGGEGHAGEGVFYFDDIEIFGDRL